MEKKTSNKKGKKDWVSRILLIFFILVFIFAGFRLFHIFYAYRQAEAEYRDLENVYITELPSETDDAEENETVVDEPEDPYPDWDIDFEQLQAVNSDMIGWLYVPAGQISYPIMQTNDNDYYLTRTFEKKINSSGAIFMDYENAADFSDLNTFIYGHNMRNDSMFGKLKNLYREDGVREENPYFYIYLPDNSVKKYQIISYYITTDESDSYSFVENEEEYQSYLNKISKRSIETIESETPNEAKIVTLSTCSGQSGGNQRLLVHGLCVETFYR